MEKFHYLVFILGYDLLQDYLQGKTYEEAHEECMLIVSDFIFSHHYMESDGDEEEYDALVKFLNENKYI